MGRRVEKLWAVSKLRLECAKVKTLFVGLIAITLLTGAVDAQQPSIATSEKAKKELAATCKVRVENLPEISIPENCMGKNERYLGGPTIRFTLFEDGRIHKVKLVKSSGVKKLDEYELKVIRGAKYKPMPACPALETTMTLLIHFSG
jgi:TonB family protein